MNKVIGFVLQPRKEGLKVISVRKAGDEYKHKPYERLTDASVARFSHLSCQPKYKLTMTPSTSFYLVRSFHAQI